MDSIRIKNLHCIADTGNIPLKPINILVGANSSGKSSFLRTFPLIKQGLDINKRGSILWSSEDVDFGDFKKSVRNGEKELVFEYKIEPYTFKLVIVEHNDVDYVNQLEVLFYDQNIKININSKSEFENIIINDEVFARDLNIRISNSRESVLPYFRVEEPTKSINQFKELSHFGSMFLDKEVNLTLNRLLKGISEKSINSIKQTFGHKIQSKNTTLINIKTANQLKTWSKLVSDWDINTPEFVNLNNRLVLSITLPVLDILNTRLTSYYKNSSYIGPLRATAERYYRRQNLSLNTIDSKGVNLPMFINDLSDSDKRDLRAWMSMNFGFYLLTNYSGGHIEISLINEKTNERFNLADNGFGFSQILPILILLWSIAILKKNNRKNSYNRSSPNDVYYFTIEQPELHLHPYLQAKLADVFISAVNTAKESGIKLKLIIETHSETIINRIGQRISESELENSDVTIALFQNKPNDSGINVVQAEFNDDGFLENWPVGFFNAI
jgi:predicted ATP-dependent endonuclease of OLD family